MSFDSQIILRSCTERPACARQERFLAPQVALATISMAVLHDMSGAGLF